MPAASPLRQRAVIEGWLPTQMANGSHGHWRPRQAALTEAARIAYWTAREAVWHRLGGKVRLSLVLVFPEHRKRDQDNLYGRVKGLVDGLKGDTGFFVDDDTDHLELLVTARVEKGRKAVEMELEAVA